MGERTSTEVITAGYSIQNRPFWMVNSLSSPFLYEWGKSRVKATDIPPRKTYGAKDWLYGRNDRFMSFTKWPVIFPYLIPVNSPHFSPRNPTALQNTRKSFQRSIQLPQLRHHSYQTQQNGHPTDPHERRRNGVRTEDAHAAEAEDEETNRTVTSVQVECRVGEDLYWCVLVFWTDVHLKEERKDRLWEIGIIKNCVRIQSIRKRQKS